jgi:UDP-N-acetylmuramate: L-alanyl-gamma-D-glutamyl-meso-diaminopimelate ligase
VAYAPDGTTFTLVHDGNDQGRFRTSLGGAFNVRNCLAAVAAARAVGASWDGIREGLETFRSVRRRMEVRGQVRGVTVIDDFAHHPTAVRETLQATRQRFQGSRVLAVFEPRSYTAQRRESQAAFEEALAGADRVVLAGLFRPERYDAETGMDPAELVDNLASGGVEATYIPEVDDIVRTLAEEAREGDVVLVMSNGAFGGIHQKLLDALGG